MSEFVFACGSAIGLGLLTSISPCPLATNIAAISFVGRRFDEPRRVFASGLLYIAGRSLTYVVLGVLLSLGAVELMSVSHALQTWAYRLLGPVLIVVGMLLLGLFRVRATPPGWIDAIGKRAARHGVWGAFGLGIIFGIAFCPVSAGIFFGTLIPLAAVNESPVTLPALYGLGTTLPVCVFAGLIAFGAQRLGRAFDRVSDVERYARHGAGVIFILVGIYETLASVFGLW